MDQEKKDRTKAAFARLDNLMSQQCRAGPKKEEVFMDDLSAMYAAMFVTAEGLDEWGNLDE